MAKNLPLRTVLSLFTIVLLAVLLVLSLRNQPKMRKYDSSSIMNRISFMQELALVRHNYTGVISYKDYMKFLNINVPLTDKYFLLKYNGYIKAGVDFNRIKVDVLNDTSVHVSIPKPTILETSIDENSVQVYNESQNAFNPIKISDYNEAISREKDVMVRDAIRGGIYTQAAEQAKLAIRSLLQQMGYTDVQITEELTLPQWK